MAMARARVLAVTMIASAAATTAALSGCGGSSSSKVLTVGSFHGKAGEYSTIQAAVDAAHPGDWILIGPGDYHETADAGGPQGDPAAGDIGGVYINKANLHIRGMDRNAVVVDGTKAGAPKCSSAPGDQNFGTTGSNGKAVGRNGILIWKADGVSVDNLTVCNFLAGSGDSGNQVWWDGGADSGTIGMHGYSGSYLTATSTYFASETTASEYGIFAGNTAGPGSWDQLYANNMNDSGAYVGACQQQCNATINQSWFQYNALGYSGTNSGGAVVIENSEFDHNQDGLDTNSQVHGDAPGPQIGTCPGRARSSVTSTTSCWVFVNNFIHDNNNSNAPSSGGAAAGPVGTGMTVSGGTFDTVMDNRFVNNGAWGALFIPYADSNPPSNGQTCSGIGGRIVQPFGCVLDPKGNAMIRNTFTNNGFFGNPGNADFGQVALFAGEPFNCYRDNTAAKGSSPPDLETTQPKCEGTSTQPTTGVLLSQLLCDTRVGSCPAGSNYPKPGVVTLHPLPTDLPTMGNPCQDVPGGPWCSGGKPIS
jgi:hypothetical protein